ncbi:MAG: alpha/beta hydrolase [Gammaproteobacteria bacterium]
MNDNETSVILEPKSKHTASVIWLHGLGADGHDFEPVIPALKLPENHGIRFIFPHAPVQAVTINGGMEMRAWYDILEVNLRKQEDVEGIKSSQKIIEALIDQEISQGIPSDKILLAGFSQGGVVILHTGLRYAKPLGGLLALSTYLALPDRLTEEANPVNSNTPIFMAHGTMDPIIPLQQGLDSSDQLKQAGYQVDWQEYPMQHSVSLEEIEKIGHWITAKLKFNIKSA